MKKLQLAAILILGTALASPALAMRVSNLDNMPHTVLFEGAGTQQQTRTIAAGETEYFTGQSRGTLSLISPQARPNVGNLHADGLLSGVIGAERGEEIPTDADNDYAIWPGGHLGIQDSMRRNQMR